MNAATRAAVRYCLRQGHHPLAIHNGFRGLLDDSIHELSWLGVDNWMPRGGSELGTNRALPDIDLGGIAAKFQEHRFHALLMIGGFEAFSSLLILEQGRKHYPAFHIPMTHLPATLSNNVPLTEYSLGSDTSLNALVDACDAIKQSASASRNRVFVVETQGGKCGYIATMGALAVSCNVASAIGHIILTNISDGCMHGVHSGGWYGFRPSTKRHEILENTICTRCEREERRSHSYSVRIFPPVMSRFLKCFDSAMRPHHLCIRQISLPRCSRKKEASSSMRGLPPLGTPCKVVFHPLWTVPELSGFR